MQDSRLRCGARAGSTIFLLTVCLPKPLPFADVRISPADAATLYGDAQGNTLKGHGREFSTFLFLEFTDAAHTRGWLRQLLATPAGQGGVVSTAQQLEQRAAYAAAKLAGRPIDAGPFVSLLFTAMGLKYLEARLPAEATTRWPAPRPARSLPRECAPLPAGAWPTRPRTGGKAGGSRRAGPRPSTPCCSSPRRRRPMWRRWLGRCTALAAAGIRVRKTEQG